MAQHERFPDEQPGSVLDAYWCRYAKVYNPVANAAATEELERRRAREAELRKIAKKKKS